MSLTEPYKLNPHRLTEKQLSYAIAAAMDPTSVAVLLGNTLNDNDAYREVMQLDHTTKIAKKPVVHGKKVNKRRARNKAARRARRRR